MKLKEYIWLAALPIAFAACQEEVLEERVKQGVTTLTATMGGETPDSRAQIVIGGTSTTQEAFHWNEGDAFTFLEMVSDGSVSQKEFTISAAYKETSPSASADFSTSAENALTASNKFVAFYPSFENEDARINASEDTQNPYYQLQIQQPEFNFNNLEGETEAEWIANYWKSYFTNNMFMRASGNVAETVENTKVAFEHLCGLIRISYTNNQSSNVTIKSISLDGTWQDQLNVSDATMERLTGDQQLPPNGNLKFTSYGFNTSINSGETRDFYFLFFPTDDSAATTMTKISVEYITGSSDTETQIYTTPSTYNGKDFSVSGFEAGKCYWFNITETGDDAGGYSLKWTNENAGGEEEENPDEESAYEVSTLDQLLEALTVENAIINLTKDIELTAPITVNKPVTINLNNYTLGLAGSYQVNNGEDAVITINNANVNIYNGTLAGYKNTGGSNHNYYMKVSGLETLYMSTVTLTPGPSSTNAIYSESAPVATRKATIETDGYALYCVNKNADLYISINHFESTIKGNIYYETNKEYREQYGIDEINFIGGTIEGNLTTVLPESLSKNQIIFLDTNVTIDKNTYTGWDNVGVYTEE